MSRRICGSMGGRPVVGVGGWVQWRSTSRRCHRSTVSEFDDEKRRVSSRVIECAAEESEDCSVGFVESRPFDLTLQHQDLVAECKDLRIA